MTFDDLVNWNILVQNSKHYELNQKNKHDLRRNEMLSLYAMYQNIKNFFLNDEKGQGLVEYALIIILISLIVLIAYNPVTSGLSLAFSRIGSALLK